MIKEELRRVRNEMIKSMWEENKLRLSMEEVGYIFGLKIAHIYRILKKVELKNLKIK